MASTGNNGTVQLWQDGEKLDNGCCQCLQFFLPDGLLFCLDQYPRAPNDIVYRERDSLMAVACMNGHVSIRASWVSISHLLSSCVYVHPTLSDASRPLGDPMELRVGPPEVRQSVGTLVWGKGPSADTLFASSESQSTTDFSGRHVAFDPDQGRCTYEFSAKESGDAMALDPDGSVLPSESNPKFPKQANS